MSPASKFWLGVIILSFLLISIKEPLIFSFVVIVYLIVSSVLYFIINDELKRLLLQQEYYEEYQRKEKATTWLKNHYSTRTKEIERYLFYLKFILIHWVVTAFNSFNNFLNNKFSKNG